RSVEDSETAANGRLIPWRITHADPGIEILLGLVKRMRCRTEAVRSLRAVDVELDIQIACLAQRGIVLESQPIVQRELRSDSPFILSVPNVVLLLAFALAGSTVVEDTRIGQVADKPITCDPVREKIRQTVIR